jgi:ribosomal protein S27E
MSSFWGELAEAEDEPMDTSSVSVWCHTCSDLSTAHLNADSELQCTLCHSTFVEETGQDVERFLEFVDTGGEGVGETPNHESQQPAPAPSPSPFPNNNRSNETAGPFEMSAFLSQLLAQIPNRNGGGGGILDRPFVVVQGGSIVHSSSSPSSGAAADLQGNAALMQLLLSSSIVDTGRTEFFPSQPDALSNAQFEQFLHHVLVNEASHAGAPAASDELLSSLVSETVAPNADLSLFGECSISQEAFDYGDVVVSLPCGHRFKREPVHQWLRMHRTCPVCRVDVSSRSL